MTSIVSRDNPRYRALQKLVGSASARRRAQCTFIEGTHLCESYLARHGAPRECVLADGALENPQIAALARRIEPRLCLVLSSVLFRSLSQLEQGAGIGFVIDIPTQVPPATLAAPAVLIDRLQDPGNLGSILRSACAAGVWAIYCAKGTVAAWSPKVLRAGMGAHFALSITEDCALEDLVRHAEIPVYTTSSHAPVSLYTLDLSGPVAWIFGNEGHGVAASIHQGAQGVAIPQPGGMESLNVAAAAAICLFEGVRQRLD